MIRSSAIPTINELRAFEAVARLGSFSAAAEELGCSQPCVTHRLKSFERRWAVDLFKRTTRAVEWTDETTRVYERIRNALLELEQLAAKFDPSLDGRQLTVTVSPSFASSWLISRLSSFRERHPAIELKLSATNRYVDLSKENFDLGVRLLPRGCSLAPDLVAVELTDERLIVVAGPAYAAHWGRSCTPADLRHSKLIWQEGTDHWPQFFQRFLGAGAEAPNGSSFNNADLVIKSAMDNQGVAIVRELLVTDDIRDARLVKLMEQSIECTDAYYLVAPRHRFGRPPVQRFRAWLTEVIGADPRGAAQSEVAAVN